MCLVPFYDEQQLERHAERCCDIDVSRIEMPDDEVLKFEKHKALVRQPLVVYADCECILEPISSCAPARTGSFTEKYQHHIPYAFGAVSVKSCCPGKLVHGDYENFTGPDCADKFLDYLIRVARTVRSVSYAYPDLNMRPEDEVNFQTSTTSWVCKDELNDDAVRDHCHTCGKFRGVAHSSCNSELQSTGELIVLFHNLRRYDGHILIRALGDRCAATPGRRIQCIAKATEDYIYFTLIQSGGKRRSNGRRNGDSFRIRFINSCQFLMSSLDNLARCLPADEFASLDHFFATQRVDLLKRKGVFPYDYLDSWKKLEDRDPPPKVAFDNRLNASSISEEDYQHVLTVWQEFHVLSLQDYMEIYLKTDVLLLCDVFENFRRFALTSFNLDPCHYFTLPSFSRDACLKLTGAQLELLSDVDMYKLFEEAIRGGVTTAPKRYAVANNQYVGNENPSIPRSFLMYIDANNLYGGGMVENLAVGDFKWLTQDEIEWLLLNIMSVDFNGDHGMILVVDLRYPAKLHHAHNCYPLAPERLAVEESMLSLYCRALLGDKPHVPHPKLVQNLMDKHEYPVDARLLQFYLGHGLELVAIHRGIKYKQQPWMRPYIEFNTRQRQAAGSKLMKIFFKLMNNSVYGKTMENKRKHIELELVTITQRLIKVTRKPEFVRATIFTDNLVACLKQRRSIKLDKPIYVGFSVLELSKMTMYRFHYDVMRERYFNNVTLLMSDTDSFIYEIFTEDVCQDMLAMLDEYDFSEYPTDHFLFSLVNKAVLKKMKDETKSRPIKKFVVLRPKMYSYCYDDIECKRAKGVKKDVVRNVLTYDDYEVTLMHNRVRYHDMNMIRSYLHEIYTVKLHKKSLASFDDKRYILPDGIHTLAHGHCDIPGIVAAGAADDPAGAPPQ